MEFEEKVLPFIKEHGIALSLGIVGIVLVGYGFFTVSQSQKTDSNFSFEPTEAVSPEVRSNVSPVTKEITIDIEGAVEKPGVYKLPSESRVQDALIASGGLSADADRQKVAQMLNLAASLTDSAKLYIPAVGEQYIGSEEAANSSSGTGVQGSSTVNINQASSSDLDNLPGIGPVTAQKIISNRPYQSVQDLLDKKVVGQSEFEKIKDQISVY